MAVKGKQKMAAVETSNFITLASVDVSGFTKARSGRKYLSWSHAAHQLLRHFPQAEMEVVTNEEGHPFFKTELGYFVHCKVTVEGITREQWYPVWDNKYETIGTPTASDINNSIQRGMTKTIALHGLGLHVYANEDLPLEEVADDKPVGKQPTEPKKASNNGQQVSPEVQAEWNKIVREAENTWAGMAVDAKDKDGNDVADRPAWKQEVQDKFVALYSKPNGFNFYANTWKDLSRAELDVAYKSLFPDLVDEE